MAQVPTLPHAFYGELNCNLDGKILIAKIEGSERGRIRIKGNSYGGAFPLDPKLIVKGNSSDEGKQIEFFIDNVRVGEFTWHSGEVTKLDFLEINCSLFAQPQTQSEEEIELPPFTITPPMFPILVVPINITKGVGEVSITIPNISVGIYINVTIGKVEKLPIRGLVLSVVTPVKNVQIKIKKLLELPPYVTVRVVGKVYYYIYIDKMNIKDEDINKTIIKFAVEKSWMKKENVSAEHIVLLRWSGSEWEKLPTKIIGEDAENYFFEAESYTLSIFAITAMAPAITPSKCMGKLFINIVGNETCRVNARLTATNCDGLSWEIRHGEEVKCSGRVFGKSYSYTCPAWIVGVGNYTYELFIDTELKDSELVTCPPLAFSIPSELILLVIIIIVLLLVTFFLRKRKVTATSISLHSSD